MVVLKHYQYQSDELADEPEHLHHISRASNKISKSDPVIRGVSVSPEKCVLEKIKHFEQDSQEKEGDSSSRLDFELQSDNPVMDRAEIDQGLVSYRKRVELEIEQYKRQSFSQIEQEKKAAMDEAHQVGLAAGKKEALADHSEKSRQLLQTINEVVHEKNKILKAARGEVLRLALKISEQILKSEISLNQAVCVNIVAEAISKVTDKDKVIIRVHRSDADFVRLNKDRILAHMSDIKNLVIQDDPRIEQGGCIIETNLGYIDSTISTKLESIEKALLKTYEEEQLEELNNSES